MSKIPSITLYVKVKLNENLLTIDRCMPYENQESIIRLAMEPSLFLVSPSPSGKPKI
ncbi:hypothetical protein Hanom_Chr00s002545g01701361 [Helianthus anomalus]